MFESSRARIMSVVVTRITGSYTVDVAAFKVRFHIRIQHIHILSLGILKQKTATIKKRACNVMKLFSFLVFIFGVIVVYVGVGEQAKLRNKGR